MKNLGQMIAQLYREHKDAHFPLVFEQVGALQEQYRRENGAYHDNVGRLKQETFAYLIVKKNLELGYYRK